MTYQWIPTSTLTESETIWFFFFMVDDYKPKFQKYVGRTLGFNPIHSNLVYALFSTWPCFSITAPWHCFKNLPFQVLEHCLFPAQCGDTLIHFLILWWLSNRIILALLHNCFFFLLLFWIQFLDFTQVFELWFVI